MTREEIQKQHGRRSDDIKLNQQEKVQVLKDFLGTAFATFAPYTRYDHAFLIIKEIKHRYALIDQQQFLKCLSAEICRASASQVASVYGFVFYLRPEVISEAAINWIFKFPPEKTSTYDWEDDEDRPVDLLHGEPEDQQCISIAGDEEEGM